MLYMKVNSTRNRKKQIYQFIKNRIRELSRGKGEMKIR